MAKQQHECGGNVHLNSETLLELLARGRDGLSSGKFKVPKFVLHS